MFFFRLHCCGCIVVVIIIIFMLSSIHVSNWCLYSRLHASKLCWYIIYILSFPILLGCSLHLWSAGGKRELSGSTDIWASSDCRRTMWRGSLSVTKYIMSVDRHHWKVQGSSSQGGHTFILYWWVNWLMFNLLIKMRHKWSAAYVFVLFIIVLLIVLKPCNATLGVQLMGE